MYQSSLIQQQQQQQNGMQQQNDKKIVIINQSDNANNFNRKATTSASSSTSSSFNTIKINPNNINFINNNNKQSHQSSSSSIEMMNQNVAAAAVASAAGSVASVSIASTSSQSHSHSQSLLSSPYHTHGNKRRKQDSKTGKGLRHFSTKVCEKVRNKGVTTYNEVADELVAEFSADPIANGNGSNGSGDQEPFDQKNIRRRVYDAINVLMAINIISKEKKEIKWVGLPTNAAQEFSDKEKIRQQRLDRIQKKRKQLRELLLQQIAFKNLIDRNQLQKNPDNNSIIKLPFIIVNTDKKTFIDCSISRDKSEYVFNFSSTFEIHDDFEIMKRMGLAYYLDRLESGDEIKFQDYQKAMNFLQDSLKPELIEMIEEKNIKIVN